MRNYHVVFFDGECGFCQGWMRFLAERDHAGRLRFAPRDGETFRALVPERTAARLPESVIVLTPDGFFRTESDAALWLLERAGGGWTWVARAGWLVPRPVRNLGYRGVARVRRLLPARDGAEACAVGGLGGSPAFLP